MKKSFFITLFFVLLLSSCASKRNFELSEFKVNGKEHNALIQDRYPYNDIGSPYGDVRMDQISLEITQCENGDLSGIVTNSETKKGLPYPQIELRFKEAKDSLKVMADSLGKFTANIPDRLKTMKVEYVGFEPLIIDMSNFK